MPVDEPPPRLRDPWSSDRRGASAEDHAGEGGAACPDESAPPTYPPPPELPLPALDPPPLLPPPPLGTAEPPPSPPPRGTAEPVVFPLDVRSCAAAMAGMTGDRERHGTGDEISLTSHNASEHVCRRTAEPTSTQQACQTRWSKSRPVPRFYAFGRLQSCPFQSPGRPLSGSRGSRGSRPELQAEPSERSSPLNLLNLLLAL